VRLRPATARLARAKTEPDLGMLGARPAEEHNSRVPAADRWAMAHRKTGFTRQPSLYALAHGKRQTVREVLESQQDMRDALAQVEAERKPQETAPVRPQSAVARTRDLEGWDAQKVFARPKSAGMLRQDSPLLRPGSAPVLPQSEPQPPRKPPRKSSKPPPLPGSHEERAIKRATIPQFPGAMINSNGPERLSQAILKDVVNQSYFGHT
jgi:hypothetical protein